MEGFDVRRLRSRRELSVCFGQPGRKSLADRIGDLILDRKDVGNGPVVPCGPKLASAGYVDQLGGDPQPFARPSNASFEDFPHSKTASDFP